MDYFYIRYVLLGIGWKYKWYEIDHWKKLKQNKKTTRDVIKSTTILFKLSFDLFDPQHFLVDPEGLTIIVIINIIDVVIDPGIKYIPHSLTNQFLLQKSFQNTSRVWYASLNILVGKVFFIHTSELSSHYMSPIIQYLTYQVKVCVSVCVFARRSEN